MILLIWHPVDININNKYIILAITPNNEFSKPGKLQNTVFQHIHPFMGTLDIKEDIARSFGCNLLSFYTSSVCIHGRRQRNKCHRRANAGGNVLLSGCALTSTIVSVCVCECISHVGGMARDKPSPMLFLTTCLHGNRHICKEWVISRCVAEDFYRWS